MTFPKGLSLIQAPPFIVVSGFFMTACFFWVLGSLLELFAFFRNGLNLPLLVHITTIGFALFVMFGALFQMLPVVAGAVIKEPKKKAFPSWLLLILGYLPFILGFYLKNLHLILLGSLLLLMGVLYTAGLMLYHLLRIKSHTPTAKGMKFSLFSVCIGAVFGFSIVLSYTGFIPFSEYIVRLHIGFMLFGWVFLLIASVSFQVVEMFFVTKAYPKSYAMNFSFFLFPLLVFSLFDNLYARLPLTLLILSHTFLTFHRLFVRKRKASDMSLYFWYTAFANLAISAFVFLFKGYSNAFLFSFGLFFSSLIVGMMFRIIPFLVWFHLSNEGSKEVPLMSEVIGQKTVFTCFALTLMLSLSLYSLSILEITLLTLLIHFALSLCVAYGVFRGSLLYFRLSPLYNVAR